MANLLAEWEADSRRPYQSSSACAFCHYPIYYKTGPSGERWLYRHLDYVGKARAAGSAEIERREVWQAAHRTGDPEPRPEFHAYFK